MSQASDDIVKGLTDEYQHEVLVIDINRLHRSPHRIPVRRWVAMSALLARTLTLPRARTDAVYITLSQSLRGGLRDALLCAAPLMRGVPIVAHIHGGSFHSKLETYPAPARHAIQSLLSRIDRYIVLDESFVEQVTRRVPSADVCVVPNAPAREVEWHFDSHRTTRDARATPLRVLWLSNLHVSKGLDDVLRAAALLYDSGIDDIQFNIAGSWPKSIADTERTRLEQKARELDTVSLIGHVSGADRIELLANSDVFVLPSRYRWEGQPISAIEALHAGVPLVCTPHRGLGSLIEDGVSGIHVEEGDAEALAEALLSLHKNRRRLRAMKMAARSRSQAYRHRNMISGVDSALRQAGQSPTPQ